jgi:hypothetical protein
MNNELTTGASSFHAQQCIEKSLKAVLEENRVNIPRIHGTRLEDAWAMRKEISVEGMRVQVISRPHLLQNKKKAGFQERSESDCG